MIGCLFFLFFKCGRVEERISGETHMLLSMCYACAKARSHPSSEPLPAVGGIQV